MTMGAAAQQAQAVAAAVAAAPRLKFPRAGSSPSGSGITAEDEDNCSMTVSTSTHSEGADTGRSKSWSKTDNFGILSSEDAISPSSASSARVKHETVQHAATPLQPDCLHKQDHTHKTPLQGEHSGAQASMQGRFAVPSSASGSSLPVASAMTSDNGSVGAVVQPSQPPQTLQMSSSVALPSRALAHVPATGSPLGSPVTLQHRMVPADSNNVSYTITMPYGVRAHSFTPMGAGTAAAIVASQRLQSAPGPVPWMQQKQPGPATSSAAVMTGQAPSFVSATMSPRMAAR